MIPTKLHLDDLPERYAFLDPAGKRMGGRSVRLEGCRPAISVVASDALGRIYWLYAWAVKTDTRSLIEHIFKVQECWHPQVFGCESNSMQSLFADAIDIIADMKKRKLPLAAIPQTNQIDKDFRIRAIMHPIVGEGRLMVLERERDEMMGVPEDCLVEVTSFPMHPSRDVIDSLATACTLVPPRRIEVQAAQRRASGRYEHETGILYAGEPDEDEVPEFFREFTR